MDHFAGLDVSVKETSVCIVDDTGRIVREVKVASEPEALLALLTHPACHFKRIGLEAGPLSQWLFSALAEAGLPMICVETRHMRAVLKAQINKTDRNDARGIAQVMRAGLYRVVHVKTLRSQKLRMLLTHRKLLQSKAIAIENDLRGTLRNFGLKVGIVGRVKFEARIKELVENLPDLTVLVEPLLIVRRVLREQLGILHRRLLAIVRDDEVCRRLMTTPGVAVTQQFNTTTSMGRLTLNVLLSFAQFEREVTSERIRDKIAASKRKGLWVGGMAPLGYDTKDRKISVNQAEADRVRTIFRSYLRLGSLGLLLADLRKRGLVTKVRTLKTGKTVGGIPFTRGPIAHLLRNRFYVGEVKFKSEVLVGEQPAIIDRDLFDAVQVKLNAQVSNHKTARTKSEALLAGRIFDDRGNRMTPSHVRKGGIKYRYYLSSVPLQGSAERAGSVRRVPAVEIETQVAKSVREHLKLSASIDDRSLIDRHVARVEVQSERLVIQLVQPHKTDRAKVDGTLNVPWRKTRLTRRREILPSVETSPLSARPIRSETRATLVASIARGRRWLHELLADARADVESIAKRERCSVRQVNMTISLAFLAPDLVKAAIEGRLPRGIGVTRLRDAPVEWSRQHAMLGLAH